MTVAGRRLRLAGSRASGRERHGFLSSAAVVFVGNVVARGLGFLFPLVLARVTARTDFALTYFLINTGFSAGELVLAGYPTAMTRYVSADPAGRAKWVASGVAAGFPLLALSLAAGFILALQADAPLPLMAVVLCGLTIDAYYFALLRGLGWFGTLMVYRIAANAAQLVVLVAAASVGAASVPLAVAAYSLLYLAPIGWIEWRRAPIRTLLAEHAVPEMARLRTLTKFAVPALVSGVAYAAIQGLDVYFVRMLASGQQADYGAARSLAMPMQLVPFAVTVILLPRVASARPAERVRLLRTALVVTIAGLALASAAYPLIARPLIDLLLPATYGKAADLVVFLAPALGLVGLYSVLSQWWMGSAKTVLPAACLCVGAVSAAASELLLTPRLGAAGAALSIAIGALVAIVLLGTRTAIEIERIRADGRSEPAAATPVAADLAASAYPSPAAEPELDVTASAAFPPALEPADADDPAATQSLQSERHPDRGVRHQ